VNSDVRLVIHWLVVVLVVAVTLIALNLILDLAHLIIDVTVTRGLEYLMPLPSLWIELVHVVGSAIRICSSKEIEQATVLHHGMACSWRIYNSIIHDRWVIIVPGISISKGIRACIFFALFIVHVLFRNDTLPFSELQVFVIFGKVYTNGSVGVLYIIIIGIQIVINVFEITVLLVS
jgi:hypothetical protein